MIYLEASSDMSVLVRLKFSAAISAYVVTVIILPGIPGADTLVVLVKLSVV